MVDPIQLERLHVYLNKVMSDDQIMANPRFMPKGLAKIAKYMNVSEDEVHHMVEALSAKLNALTEDLNDEPRFTYESDSLGGITVRDSETAQEKYLNIRQAHDLMKMLDGDSGTEQKILAKIMTESVLVENWELSADEIDTDKSIFNFPWKLNESRGFAAAEYSGFGHKFRMKIVSVVDHDGNAISHYDRKGLIKIARSFIDEA